MEDIAVAFWKRVNELIKARGMKQETVAQNCNISYQTFRGWITRHTFPDGIQTYAIARELKTSVEYLVTGSEPENHAAERLGDVKKLLDEAVRIANQ